MAGGPGYDKGIGWESQLSITHRNNSYAANFMSQFKSNELLVIYLVLLSMDSFFFFVLSSPLYISLLTMMPTRQVARIRGVCIVAMLVSWNCKKQKRVSNLMMSKIEI